MPRVPETSQPIASWSQQWRWRQVFNLPIRTSRQVGNLPHQAVNLGTLSQMAKFDRTTGGQSCSCPGVWQRGKVAGFKIATNRVALPTGGSRPPNDDLKTPEPAFFSGNSTPLRQMIARKAKNLHISREIRPSPPTVWVGGGGWYCENHA